VAKWVTRGALEKRIGVERVRQLFDDDRDGVLNDAEEETLNEILSEADDTVTAALLQKGWNADQLNGLSEDRALRRAACQIAAELSGERRPEFRDEEGFGPYDKMGERGRDTLKSFARGESRSRLEPSVGANKALRGRHSASDPVTIFGRNPGDPNDKMGDDKGF
jgi:hypothetical protein